MIDWKVDKPAEMELQEFQCAQCYKVMCSNMSLKRHEKTHSGARPFQCQFCHKCFTRKDILKRHIALTHPELCLKYSSEKHP